jgi:molecular chaperone GrpE
MRAMMSEPKQDNMQEQRATEPDVSPADQAAPEQATTDQAATSQARAEPAREDAAARVAELEAELAEMKERWMRSEAENANVRARAKKDVDDTRQYAVQKFAADVVEAAENLRRGIAALPAPAEGQPEILGKVREGLEGVERSFLATLERNGIRRQDPHGQPFDPNLHQAMAEQETDAHPPGTVIQAWSSAWTLNGRLLRPAMVVVAKAPLPELTGNN